jgi:hypothetical protein
VPVGGVIKEVEAAFSEVVANPNTALLWNERLRDIPIGAYNAAINMKNNSEQYLLELLSEGNCKGMVCDVANIASFLNSHDRHSGHGRGIDLRKAKELGLNVKDLSKNKKLEDRVLSIYHSAVVMFDMVPNITKVILNQNENANYITNSGH